MASIQEGIRSRMETAIEPYRSSKQKSPFSAKQLIAIALTLQPQYPARGATDIFRRITTSLKYHNDLMLFTFTSYNLDDSRDRPPPCGIREERVTIIRLREDVRSALLSIDEGIEIDEDLWQPRYGMLASNAERILEPHLMASNDNSHAHAGVFRFIDLPDELRKYRYELVCVGHRSGLEIIDNDAWSPRSTSPPLKVFGAFANDFYEPFSYNRRWDNHEESVILQEWRRTDLHDGSHLRPHFLKTRPISEILTPLLLSRKISSEAMPIFHNLNNFCCEEPSTMESFLHALHPTRLQHLGKLAFSLGHHIMENLRHVREIFILLRQVKHLRELNILAQLGGTEIKECRHCTALFCEHSDRVRVVKKSMPSPLGLGLVQPGALSIGQLNVRGSVAVEQTIRAAMRKELTVDAELIALPIS